MDLDPSKNIVKLINEIIEDMWHKKSDLMVLSQLQNSQELLSEINRRLRPIFEDFLLPKGYYVKVVSEVNLTCVEYLNLKALPVERFSPLAKAFSGGLPSEVFIIGSLRLIPEGGDMLFECLDPANNSRIKDLPVKDLAPIFDGALLYQMSSDMEKYDLVSDYLSQIPEQNQLKFRDCVESMFRDPRNRNVRNGIIPYRLFDPEWRRTFAAQVSQMRDGAVATGK
jgi:hypothetical protein